jgi:hypothetical protein
MHSSSKFLNTFGVYFPSKIVLNSLVFYTKTTSFSSNKPNYHPHRSSTSIQSHISSVLSLKYHFRNNSLPFLATKYFLPVLAPFSRTKCNCSESSTHSGYDKKCFASPFPMSLLTFNCNCDSLIIT